MSLSKKLYSLTMLQTKVNFETKFEIFEFNSKCFLEHLRAPLDEYIKNYPKVKVIRSYRRLGIISNRLLGAVNAVGPVFVYVRKISVFINFFSSC